MTYLDILRKNMKNRKALGIILAILITLLLAVFFWLVFSNQKPIDGKWHQLPIDLRKEKGN